MCKRFEPRGGWLFNKIFGVLETRGFDLALLSKVFIVCALSCFVLNAVWASGRCVPCKLNHYCMDGLRFECPSDKPVTKLTGAASLNDCYTCNERNGNTSNPAYDDVRDDCYSCYEIDTTKPYWDGTTCASCPVATPNWNGSACVSCSTGSDCACPYGTMWNDSLSKCDCGEGATSYDDGCKCPADKPYYSNIEILRLDFDKSDLTNNAETNLSITASGVSYSDDAISGMSADFSDGGLITIKDASSWFPVDSDFTIEFYAKFNDLSRQALFAGSEDYSIGIDLWGDTLNMWVSSWGDYWDPISSDWDMGRGTTIIETNKWYHVAMVREGTTWRTFVDGNLEKELTDIYGNPYFDGRDFRIGLWGTNGYQFYGKIDNFRISNIAKYETSFDINFVQNPYGCIAECSSDRIVLDENLCVSQSDANALKCSSSSTVPHYDYLTGICMACEDANGGKTPIFDAKKCVSCAYENSELPYWDGFICTTCPNGSFYNVNSMACECAGSAVLDANEECVCPSDYPYWVPVDTNTVMFLTFDSSEVIDFSKNNLIIVANNNYSSDAISGMSADFSDGGLITIKDASSWFPVDSDFTIEFYAKFNDLSRQALFAGSKDYSVGIDLWGDTLNMWVSSWGDYWDPISSDWDMGRGTTIIETNRWYHVAMVREGTTWRTFVDGNLEKELTDIYGNPYFDGRDFRIGLWGTDGYQFHGKIDNFRISNIARYSSSFENTFNNFAFGCVQACPKEYPSILNGQCVK